MPQPDSLVSRYRDRKAVARFDASQPGNESLEEMAQAAEEMIRRGYDLGPFKPD